MRYGPIANDAFDDRMPASSVAPVALFDSFTPLVLSVHSWSASGAVFEGLRGGSAR
jgi:hypothetical protein